MKEFLAAVVCIAGWLLLCSAGWRVATGVLLLLGSAWISLHKTQGGKP